MNEFCTITDLGFLSRVLVLRESLESACDTFRLRVLCMDSVSADILESLGLPGITVLRVETIEQYDPALAGTKATRTLPEYCWTAKAVLCLYALEYEPELGLISYVDADHTFASDPSRLFEELGDDAVLIIPHRTPTSARGLYNAGFIAFRRHEAAFAVLSWWRERCLEWCYDRFEDGRSPGDQGYLDSWPRLFTGVHVLQHPGGGLAPWNISFHRLEEQAGRVMVDGQPLIFFHHQSLRLIRATSGARLLAKALRAYRLIRGPVDFVWWIGPGYGPPPDEAIELIWKPYLRRLAEATVALSRLTPSEPFGVESLSTLEVAGVLADSVRRRSRWVVWNVRRVARRFAATGA
jgi:hypothetical protein